jgi:hypothetical protein
MHFFVVDARFGTPIYVLLENDPNGAEDYPGLAVRVVTLELIGAAGPSRRCALGRDPNNLDRFREFVSDGAVARAGFLLLEPRYVGATWDGYCRHFRPEGEKPAKQPGPTVRGSSRAPAPKSSSEPVMNTRGRAPGSTRSPVRSHRR